MFGRLKSFITNSQNKSEIDFVLFRFTTIGYEEDLNSFEVIEANEIITIERDLLLHYKPLNIWKLYDSEASFICPKFSF